MEQFSTNFSLDTDIVKTLILDHLVRHGGFDVDGGSVYELFIQHVDLSEPIVWRV